MTTWGDRFNRFTGKTQFGVVRLFVHLAGKDVAPLLGVLHQAARQAVDQQGDMQTMGAGLVEICQTLLQYDTYWQSAANEAEVFWDEGEAGDFVEELFTDSAQRYRSGASLGDVEVDEFDTVPITQNVVLMLTIAYEGAAPDLETILDSVPALQAGLKAVINLHYQERLRAIQVHFSPAQLGDELTADQLIQNFPELIPL